MKSFLAHSRSIAVAHRFARVWFAIALAAIVGCESKDAPAPASAAHPLAQSAEKGPVQLTVTADRAEVTVGEPIQFAIVAVAESGVAIEMPRFENQIGVFEIVDSHLPPDIPDGDKRRWAHRYTLRTLESGDQEIPSITVKFVDRRSVTREDEESPQSEISTKPLTIHVRSLLAGEFNPEQFRDIKEEVAVPLPWNYHPWLYALGAALLVGAAVTAIVLLMRRKGERVEIAPPPPPPHVWALQQLDQLASEHLIELGEHHEFFFRLSSIVRQYIERRFFIMAAEQTTDEFLREAQRNPSLTQTHRELLGHFLRQADMVKFARFQPLQHESEAALDAARRFVHDTSPEAGPTPVAQMAEVGA